MSGMKLLFVFLAVLLLLCPALTVLADNEGPMDEFDDETPLRGDASGDGKVSAMDYMLVKRHVLRKTELTGENLIAADVNGDGKVNPYDYMILKRVVLGKGEFPCLHEYDETVVGNLHIFTCKKCGHQYEKFDGELIG